MSRQNFNTRLLIALVRVRSAQTVTEAVLALISFEARTLAEYAAIHECYRSSVDRIDAAYQAQAAIRKAQFVDGTGDAVP